MSRLRAFGFVVVLSLAAAACGEEPVGPSLDTQPRFVQVGEPCDPATYTGPGRCVEDPNSESGYSIAQ